MCEPSPCTGSSPPRCASRGCGPCATRLPCVCGRGPRIPHPASFPGHLQLQSMCRFLVHTRPQRWAVQASLIHVQPWAVQTFHAHAPNAVPWLCTHVAPRSLCHVNLSPARAAGVVVPGPRTCMGGVHCPCTTSVATHTHVQVPPLPAPQGRCYGGRCKTRDRQCNALWGRGKCRSRGGFARVGGDRG